MQILKGKVILKYDRLGFIEYNIDSRISFEVKDHPNLNIGDSVIFNEVEKRVNETLNRIELQALECKIFCT